MRAALLVAASVVAAYAVSLGASFQFDDYNAIVHYAAVHSWPALGEELPRGLRPVLKATYAFDWALGGGAPWPFHLTNVLLHAANAGLLYFIGRHLAARRGAAGEGAALVAALLFALHPVQTEAVTYVSGRSIALSATFYLGALLAYLRGAPAGWGLALFALACGARETALILPAALLLCDVASRGRVDWRRQWPYWALAALLAGAALAHPRYQRFLDVALGARGIADNLLSQVQGVGYLVSRLFLPHRLNIDPALPALSSWDEPLMLQAAALLALLLVGIASLKTRPWIALGVGWFFLHLAPTNSVLPRLDVANERQLYLAWWGLAFALSVQMATLPWRKLAAGALCVALAALCVVRQLDYYTEVALWESAVREAPWNARAHNNLGYARWLAGDREGAVQAYRQALAFDPAHPQARYNLERAWIR